LLSKTCNRNKFENSSKEKINFLLQDKCNSFFLKHADAKHTVIAIFFEEVIFLLKGREKRQSTKKNSTWWVNLNFFSVKDSF